VEMARRHLESKSVAANSVPPNSRLSEEADDVETGETVWLFKKCFQAIFYRFNKHGCGLYLQHVQYGCGLYLQPAQ
jgi:hypothetical protein